MSDLGTNNMGDLINKTEILVETLENLNNEIESYQMAKDNLTDVKKHLGEFLTISSENTSMIKEYLEQVHTLMNEDFISRLDEMDSSIEQSSVQLKGSIDNLKVQSESLINQSFDQINRMIDETVVTLKSLADQSIIQADKKFKLIIGLSIINLLGLFAVIVNFFV